MWRGSTGWLRRARRFSERLWMRILLIAGLAVVAALSSAVLGPLVPEAATRVVDGDALETILDALASSMLSVTIFSLTVMVTVHRSISGQWTPRAHRLLSRDRTTMTVLANFVGAWLFSLAALILQAMGWIIDGGRVPLFFLTLVVVAMIVISIVRWIGHLERFGSLEHTAERLEAETRRAFEARMRRPCLGGRPLARGREGVPAGAHPVCARRTGWVRQIDLDDLDKASRAVGADVYLPVPVGRFVYEGEPIAFLGEARDDLAKVVREGIEIGALRGFEQDPRFGFVAMGEVASKALSSGVNDPGTAVEMIGRGVRVLEAWRDEVAAAGDPPYPTLHVPPLKATDLLEDLYAPIARDGAGQVEVQIHLQQALGALSRHDEPSMAAAARAMAEHALRRAEGGLTPDERERLERAIPRAVRRSAA